MTFKKNDIIRNFTIQRNKVIAAIKIDGITVINPTIEQLKNEGWEEYIEPVQILPEPEPYLPSIEELVEQKIREKYSINQEFQVQRKRDVDLEAFSEYYDYVEECIKWAETQPHREEEESE